MISPSIFYNNRYILFQTHHPAIYKWMIFVVIPSMGVGYRRFSCNAKGIPRMFSVRDPVRDIGVSPWYPRVK